MVLAPVLRKNERIQRPIDTFNDSPILQSVSPCLSMTPHYTFNDFHFGFFYVFCAIFIPGSFLKVVVFGPVAKIVFSPATTHESWTRFGGVRQARAVVQRMGDAWEPQ